MQFADLLRFSAVDTSAIWEKSDEFIAKMEGATSVAKARMALSEPGKSGLLEAHGLLFAGQAGAGELRQTLIAGRYPGQDCPEPEYIDNSLNNFFNWMSAESMTEVHPIEKAALVLTRIVDVWPFGFGNLTAAVMLANAYLEAGWPGSILSCCRSTWTGIRQDPCAGRQDRHSAAGQRDP